MESDGMTLIGWAGWTWRLPARFRPLHIEGDAAKGHMDLGDSARFCMRIAWISLAGRVDGKTWCDARATGLGKSRASGNAQGVGHHAWGIYESKGGGQLTWCGYAASLDLGVEVVFAADLGDTLADSLGELTLRRGEASLWRVFETSFLVPTGWTYARRRMYPGDIALEFARGRETLLVRQLYPAGVALARRSLKRWVDAAPFRDRRRLDLEAEGPAVVGSREGVRLTGWKRLAFPLGRIRPRRFDALAVHDRGLDRAMLAAWQGGPQAPALEPLVAGMQQEAA